MMQTVTFAKEYRHKLDDLREAHYPVGEFEVSNEVAEAARKAGVLEEVKHGRGSTKTNREGSDLSTEG
jgi:hypothetical protein